MLRLAFGSVSQQVLTTASAAIGDNIIHLRTSALAALFAYLAHLVYTVLTKLVQ